MCLEMFVESAPKTSNTIGKVSTKYCTVTTKHCRKILSTLFLSIIVRIFLGEASIWLGSIAASAQALFILSLSPVQLAYPFTQTS